MSLFFGKLMETGGGVKGCALLLETKLDIIKQGT